MKGARWKRAELAPALAFFVFTSACATPKNPSGPRAELSGPYRATRAIEGALSVGVTYADFSSLVQSLAKELLLTSDAIRFDPTADRRVVPVVERYRHLLEMYRDSEQMWGFEIRKETYDPTIAEIAKRYGLSEAVYDHKERVVGINITDHIVQYVRIKQAIWLQAGKVHEEQISMVFGGPLPPLASEDKKK